jgi:hypothetical protein
MIREQRNGNKICQTIHDVKSNKTKLMEFVKDCSSGPGPFKNSLYEEVDVALLQCFKQK